MFERTYVRRGRAMYSPLWVVDASLLTVVKMIVEYEAATTGYRGCRHWSVRAVNFAERIVGQYGQSGFTVHSVQFETATTTEGSLAALIAPLSPFWLGCKGGRYVEILSMSVLDQSTIGHRSSLSDLYQGCQVELSNIR